jgi:hypothetical protein
MELALPLESIEEGSKDASFVTEAEVQILPSYCAYDVSPFAVTINETASATLTATWRFLFAGPGRFASSPCSLTSMHCSTTPYDMSPSHLSHAPRTFAASVHLILLITCPVNVTMQDTRQK